MAWDDFAADTDRGGAERTAPTVVKVTDTGCLFAASVTIRPAEWAFLQAIEARLADRTAPVLRSGLTGRVIRTTQPAFNRVDLEAMCLPGLGALGLTADLVALPDDDTALARLLRAPARNGGVPLWAFDTEEPEVVVRQALVTDVALRSGAGDAVTIATSDGRIEVVTAAVVRQRYTHALLLRRHKAKGAIRANRQAALARWVAFEAAFPERVIGVKEADAPERAMAAEFLHLSAGGRHDRASNLLRRAAALLATPDDAESISQAFELLREHLCLTLHLPHAQTHAVLAPPDSPLSDPQRSELIYLARAATRDLKVLAARRLTHERSHSDAERTLEQLLHDPDPLVRGAARRGPEPRQLITRAR